MIFSLPNETNDIVNNLICDLVSKDLEKDVNDTVVTLEELL